MVSEEGFIQQGHQTDDPTVKRGVVNDNTALCYHLLEITQAEGISEIPANTLVNNIDGGNAGDGRLFGLEAWVGNIVKKTACYLTTP